MRGKLIVIAGPSGVGKGTVVREIIRFKKNCRVSVSVTTRKPRTGEVNGEHYYFITKQEFEDKIRNKKMLEYEQYNGNYYGTPYEYTEQNLKAGFNVILEIDVKGALNVKKMYPQALLIFLKSPSFAELKKRLVCRGTERPEEVEQRMQVAHWEMAQAEKFDVLLTNNDIDLVTKEIINIIDKFNVNIKEQQI